VCARALCRIAVLAREPLRMACLETLVALEGSEVGAEVGPTVSHLDALYGEKVRPPHALLLPVDSER
jgi:hypothetical protein